MSWREKRVLGALLACAACAPEDIVIARSQSVDKDAQVEAGVDAATDSATPRPDAALPNPNACSDNRDCDGERFCSKTRCTDARGTCERRDSVCDSFQAPVCGCDGISYLNDCLRRSAGIASSTFGECRREAQLCDPAHPCQGEATCAYLLRSCDAVFAPLSGRCWVTPSDCRSVMGSAGRYSPCAPTSGGDLCVSSCDAINSGIPHVPSTCMRGPQP